MTRETKIGLVVSCSFLCLVGVVLGNKLREMGRNQGAEVASANEADQDVKADKETHESDVGKVVPASAEEIKKLDHAPDPDEGKVLSVKANPAKEKEEPDLPPCDEVDSSKFRTPVAAKDKEKDVPIDIPSDNSKPLPTGKDGNLPPSDEPDQKDKNDKKHKETVKDKTDAELEGKSDSTKKSTLVDQDPIPEPKQSKAKQAKTDDEIDVPPEKKEPKPAKIESGNNKVDEPVSPPSDLDSVPATDERLPDSKTDDKNKKSPVKVEAPVAIGQPKNRPTTGEPTENVRPNQPTPEKETRPAVDVVVPSRQPIDKQPAATDREPGRQPIQVATAPYRRIPVTPGPEVESFDEEIYRCRTGDSFAKISQRYYQTDKYGPALEAFNRNHPQDGDAIRRQASGLAVGQRVHIPPIAVLRKRHATLISEENQPRSPDTEERTSSRPRTAQDSEENAPRSRDYTVNNPNGETMREIAEKLLGDVNRWQEIAKLNPGFQPLLPIPATASIKLP